MGIKNLHTFLRSVNQNIYQKKKIQDYENKVFAVDTSIYMCKYKSSMGNRWLQGFWLMIALFKKYNIKLIFVFDAKPPPEKEVERHFRTLQKEKIKKKVHSVTTEYYTSKKENYKFKNVEEYLDWIEKKFPNLFSHLKKHENDITNEMDIYFLIQKLENSIIRINSDDFVLLKDFLTILQVPFLNAHSEAEGTCAFLNEMKNVDGVLTEDTDVLVYGCKIMLHALKLKDEMVNELKLDDILEALQLKKEQFVDFCIMCGTDYNDNIPKLGPKTCFSLLQKNENLENIEKLEKYDTAVLNYKRVRSLFGFEDYRIEVDFKEEKPKRIDVQQFLFENNLIYTKEALELFL